MSVVVPVFNGIAYLTSFFVSLDGALPPDSQVIVIDDGSTEPVFDTIPDMAHAAEIVHLRNDSNSGYAVAVNRGFAVATREVVIQLNSDLVLQPRCIHAMIDVLERVRNVGIVGSKLIYPTTGLVQHIGMAFGDHSNRLVYAELPSSHSLCQKTRQVQIMCGATVAMTHRVLHRLGALDEGYFNENDDLDHCMRSVALGLRNIVCAESVAYHWESQSGFARFARKEASDARFWAKWGHVCSIDLDRFVDEALDLLLDTAPYLEDMPFDVLDVSRGGDQPIVLNRLAHRWPGLEHRVRPFRQMNNPVGRLWLPMLLPHWVASDPTPFIYLVDSYRELEENVLWFLERSRIVRDEVVVDLSGATVLTSELVPSQARAASHQ